MIAIIPAHISDLPNINTLNLAGKPLIAFTIEAARESKYLERILVLTNSKEIATIAHNYGAEVSFSNPMGISEDESDLNETVEQLQLEYGLRILNFVLLKPSSPLRTTHDIDEAIDLFLEKKAGSLISFYETDSSLYKAKKIVNDTIADYFKESHEIVNGYEHEKVYLPNNAIFIFNYNYFKSNGIKYSDHSIPFVMADNHSFEVKTSKDFEYAEFLVVKSDKKISALKEIDSYKVFHNLSIRDSIKKLDDTGIGFIGVVNDSNKILGIVTDGDFRRAVLSGVSLDDPIISIANSKFTFLDENYTKEEIEHVFYNNDISQVPVIKNNELQEIILRKNLPFIQNNTKEQKHLDVPVVIMAGGIGTRLKPFTHIMPKPLVPIGNKPLIEIIIERFKDSGVREFYLSLNYKGNMIKAYFEGRSIARHIKYITEDIPLGTAGALKKLKGVIKSTFFVSNCDIIIKSDYNKIIDFHRQGHYDLTLVACMHHFTIPYGVCSIEQGGDLKEISEKPEFDYLVNTGMYVLEPSILELIPDNTFYHITHLIEDLKKENRKIGVYPVYEKSWIDVGQWDEYRKAVKYLE